MKKHDFDSIPGFHVEAQGYTPGTPELWLAAWGADIVPPGQQLEAIVEFRFHHFSRDFTLNVDGIERCTALGFRVHLNLTGPMRPEDHTTLAMMRQEFPAMMVSWGNEQTPTLGPRPEDSDVIGNDGGLAAMAWQVRHAPAGKRVVGHTYGRDGVMPWHLRLLRQIAGRQRRISLTEFHWTHRQHEQNRKERPDVYTYGAGAWMRRAAKTANALGMDVCAFTGRDMLDEGGNPTPSLLAWQLETGAEPNAAPFTMQSDQARKMIYQRFIRQD